jgi:hypothetical protein
VVDILVRIKRTVLAGRYAFSEKARIEMEADGITELDVAESIVNAVAIYKRLRSRSPRRGSRREYLYVSHRRTWRVSWCIRRASSYGNEARITSIS